MIDTMVYYPGRDGHIEELDAGTLTSSALVQQHLPSTRVVKAFNNVDFHRLFTFAQPAGAPDRSALPIAGDDAAAKEQVAQLHDLLGYDTVDIGTLADSWRNGPNTPIMFSPNSAAQPNRVNGLAWQLYRLARQECLFLAAEVVRRGRDHVLDAVVDDGACDPQAGAVGSRF